MTPRAPRRGGFTPIGREVATAVKPAFDQRGFSVGEILRDWPEIVGRDYAGFTAPDRVHWPRRPPEEQEERPRPRSRRPEGATLVIRVDGPRAIEVQHRSDIVLERINTYFGWRAVSALRFVQAPVTRAERRKRRPPPSDAAVAALERELTQVRKPELRHALARLGSQIGRDEG